MGGIVIVEEEDTGRKVSALELVPQRHAVVAIDLEGMRPVCLQVFPFCASEKLKNNGPIVSKSPNATDACCVHTVSKGWCGTSPA